MRRTIAWVTAAVAASAGMAIAAVPASSATYGSLTVRTIGRDGRAVLNAPLVAVESGAFDGQNLVSGTAKRLPSGTYRVLVDIYNDRDGTDTLGARRVSVSGATTATFDARHGRAVRVALSPAAPAGYQQRFLMSLCLPDTFADLSGYADGGKLFLLPSAVSSAEFAWGAAWTPGTSSSAPRFLGAGVRRGGLPDGLSATVHRSSLAEIRISARSGPQSGRATIEASAANLDDSCAQEVRQLSVPTTLPTVLTDHVPAGYYTLSESAQDYSFDQPHYYAARRRYDKPLNRAVWGPWGDLPYTFGDGHRLYVDVTGMFTDPTLIGGRGWTAHYTLTHAGTTIVSRTVSSDGATIAPVLHSAGWYTLAESAHRRPKYRALPADALSTLATVRMHFYADPATSKQVGGFLTQFLPASLSMRDRATPGSRTSVILRVRRHRADSGIATPADSVRRIDAWFSTNRGSTWRSVAARRAGSDWVIAVPDPATGTVSLRAKVTDTHGDTTTTTVLDGYAVG